MPAPSDYAVVRESDGAFRLDRRTPPAPGPVAYARPVTDRRGAVLGWRLKPVLTVRGSTDKVWGSAAEALASTALLTLRQAKEAVADADRPADAAGQRGRSPMLEPARHHPFGEDPIIVAYGAGVDSTALWRTDNLIQTWRVNAASEGGREPKISLAEPVLNSSAAFENR